MPRSHAGTYSRPDCNLSSFHLFSSLWCKSTSLSQMSSSIARVCGLTSAANINITLKVLKNTAGEKTRGGGGLTF